MQNRMAMQWCSYYSKKLSKTCPECSRIMVIQRPVLEEPVMEGTSDADPVS